MRSIRARGGHHHPFQRSGEGNANHVLRNAIAIAHAGIETLGDDVDEMIVHSDVQMHVGIGREKRAQCRAEHQPGGVSRNVDAKGPHREIAMVFERMKSVADHLKAVRQLARQPFARFSWCDRAAGAVEQPYGKGRLQLA
ncbi:hypothetical protein ACVIM7_006545 [Bradyrhizobium liaoningense]